jgi:hypothetical protein
METRMTISKILLLTIHFASLPVTMYLSRHVGSGNGSSSMSSGSGTFSGFF